MTDEKRHCNGTNRKGEPCGLPPVPGATVCYRHGGKTPQVRKKAAERIAQANLEKEIRHEMTLLGIADIYDAPNPAEAMLHVLGATAAEERYLARRVAELSEDPTVLNWRRTDHRTGSGPEGPIDVETYSAVPDVLVGQLRDCRDRLIRYAALCVKANLDERRMALAETQADQLVAVFFRALTSVAMAQELRDEVQQAFATELRALEAA